MLLRYLLFFLLLVVVWNFLRRLANEWKLARGMMDSHPGRRRTPRPGRQRDISDAEYEILPPEREEDPPAF